MDDGLLKQYLGELGSYIVNFSVFDSLHPNFFEESCELLDLLSVARPCSAASSTAIKPWPQTAIEPWLSILGLLDTNPLPRLPILINVWFEQTVYQLETVKSKEINSKKKSKETICNIKTITKAQQAVQ